MKDLITKEYCTKEGYIFTTQRIGDVCHLQIRDSKCYPESDIRYHEAWRSYGLVIPINSKKDMKEILKLFKI